MPDIKSNRETISEINCDFITHTFLIPDNPAHLYATFKNTYNNYLNKGVIQST